MRDGFVFLLVFSVISCSLQSAGQPGNVTNKFEIAKRQIQETNNSTSLGTFNRVVL